MLLRVIRDVGGVALSWNSLPLELLEQPDLQRRVHERGGEREIQFLFRDQERILPVWHEGQLRLVAWGNRRGQSRHLPCTGWTWLATVESGMWVNYGAQPIETASTEACAYSSNHIRRRRSSP